MPILHDVQRAYGWIPEQAMEEIASFLNIDASRVLDTVTFLWLVSWSYLKVC